MSDFSYAGPATLRGQLQRGRGLGARRAQMASDGADLVYECVISDSRWDRWTESRDSYLARSIHRMDLPLAEVESRLMAHDGDDPEEVELALQVLALLPFLGRTDAVPVLRRYAVDGRHWPAALDALGWTGAWKIPEVREGIGAEVVARRGDAELAAAVDGDREPWSSWARTQPQIRRILDGYAARPTPPPVLPPVPDSYAGLSTADLAARIGGAAGRPRRLALQEMGRRGDPTVLDLAEDASLRNAAGWTPGIAEALRHLGTTAVGRARTWAGGSDPTLHRLAVGILAEVGERDDGPYLLHALTTAAAAGDWCATEPAAGGLGRLRMTGATDALVHVRETTVHSSAREAVHQGLRGCAPGVADGYSVEGLDDCEPGVQQAASAVAPDTPQVRARLRELHDDPLAPEVRDAAGRRLTQFAGA
ncbi:hypothetical protein [Kitasatospora sp. MBT63]|uniref:hypothetical protein n=1 Tax=Kitasatospora sp. MBT63 TaxID=1444768 RepID=UPI00053A022F|nr:hypothetical protein [Kitasatospora sp. MBT63]